MLGQCFFCCVIEHHSADMLDGVTCSFPIFNLIYYEPTPPNSLPSPFLSWNNAGRVHMSVRSPSLTNLLAIRQENGVEAYKNSP